MGEHPLRTKRRLCVGGRGVGTGERLGNYQCLYHAVLTSLILNVDRQDCLVLSIDGYVKPVHTVIIDRLTTNSLNV